MAAWNISNARIATGDKVAARLFLDVVKACTVGYIVREGGYLHGYVASLCLSASQAFWKMSVEVSNEH